jgi:hypothetical protein
VLCPLAELQPVVLDHELNCEAKTNTLENQREGGDRAEENEKTDGANDKRSENRNRKFFGTQAELTGVQ